MGGLPTGLISLVFTKQVDGEADALPFFTENPGGTSYQQIISATIEKSDRCDACIANKNVSIGVE